MSQSLYFTLHIDCEATQHAIQDPDLGERSIRGLGEILQQTETRGTFFVIPGDIQAHAPVYHELEAAGHEIGLHLHAADLGYDEFLGVQSEEMQIRIISEAMDIFAQGMGRQPKAFCPGYVSVNDYTYGVLERLGFTHGTLSIPTRDLPQCACFWGSSPLDAHYPHRYNRSLVGDVDFVELPSTVDAASRMWGGGHPQDLRVELVDAKNHWYTMDKAVKRQLADEVPVIRLHAATHNIFEFSDPANFRRETYLGMVSGARSIAEREGLHFIAATAGEAAQAYREAVPLQQAVSQRLQLDTRGRAFGAR